MPIEQHKELTFQIRSLSPDELAAADAVLLPANKLAPERFVKKPNVGGPGHYDEPFGRDYDHPDYIAEREKLIPLRKAMVCLAGIPALASSTPGETIQEQAARLVTTVPSTVLDQMTAAIEDLACFGAVGADDVDAFFHNGFGQSQKQPAGPAKSPRGAKRKRSKGKTPPTSPTGSGKRRGSGK